MLFGMSAEAPAQSFLPQTHQRVLDPYARFEEAQPGLGNRNGIYHDFVPQMHSLIIATARVSKDVKRVHRRLPRNISSSGDLEKHLQYDALVRVMHDRQLFFMVQALAVTTGIDEAEGGEVATWAKEKGKEAVMFRARHATTELLKASELLFMSEAFDGDTSTQSVWSRTLEAQRKSNVSGPKIVKNAWDEASSLRAKALEAGEAQQPDLPIKPSRFGLVNLYKSVKYVRGEVQDSDSSSVSLMNAFESLANPFLASMSPPLELDANAIARVTGTLTKTAKHVENAATVNSKIAEDPRTRYFSFLIRKLGASAAIHTEITAFTRLIDRTTTDSSARLA